MRRIIIFLIRKIFKSGDLTEKSDNRDPANVKETWSEFDDLYYNIAFIAIIICIILLAILLAVMHNNIRTVQNMLEQYL